MGFAKVNVDLAGLVSTAKLATSFQLSICPQATELLGAAGDIFAFDQLGIELTSNIFIKSFAALARCRGYCCA
ncbi:MAG: hypothetical protein ACYC5H_07005 [Methylovirgula sp.]